MRTSPLGADTQIVNAQLVDTPTAAAYSPFGFTPQTIGVPNVSPSLPPYIFGGSPLGTTGGSAGGGQVGGYGTAENNSMVAGIANAHPFSPKVSPVWWAVIGLVLSLVLLKSIHWRETILEGEERGRVGEAREEASASA